MSNRWGENIKHSDSIYRPLRCDITTIKIDISCNFMADDKCISNLCNFVCCYHFRLQLMMF